MILPLPVLILPFLVLPLLMSSGCAPLVVGGVAVTGASLAHDRRTTGTVIDDQMIELKAYNALDEVPALKTQAHINVTSFNGVVLLSGQVPGATLKAQASEQVRGIEKVRLVHNELLIAAPSSMASRSADGLITTRVKTALFGVKIDGFDPTRVKVVTENGVVFLMGLVTRAEAEAATERTRTIGGVQKVVRLFEYL